MTPSSPSMAPQQAVSPLAPPKGNAGASPFVFDFAEAPPPDEIVLDVDPDFGSGLRFEAEPNIGAPPSPPIPAPPKTPPPRTKSESITGLAGLFDGIDTAAPKPAPPAVSDAAFDLGDVLTNPPKAPVADTDTQALGADLVAAFTSVETESLPAPGPAPLVVRLRALAERLRAEGRHDDADVLVEAIATLAIHSTD